MVRGDGVSVEVERGALAVVRPERIDDGREVPLAVVVTADGVNRPVAVERCRGERRNEVAAVDDGLTARVSERLNCGFDLRRVVVRIRDDADLHPQGQPAAT